MEKNKINKLSLSLLPETLAVCRLGADDPVPEWAYSGNFWSVLKSGSEISVVCQQEFVPENIICEKGWKAFKVNGILSFELTGVLASIAEPLANAGISIFAVSGYDTDYVLVKEDKLKEAINALNSYGHSVESS